MNELERLKVENAKLRELVKLAIEDVSGICYLCKNKEPYHGLLISCKYLCKRGVIAASKQPKCKYFEWQHAGKLEEIDGKDGA